MDRMLSFDKLTGNVTAFQAERGETILFSWCRGVFFMAEGRAFALPHTEGCCTVSAVIDLASSTLFCYHISAGKIDILAKKLLDYGLFIYSLRNKIDRRLVLNGWIQCRIKQKKTIKQSLKGKNNFVEMRQIFTRFLHDFWVFLSDYRTKYIEILLDLL